MLAILIFKEKRLDIFREKENKSPDVLVKITLNENEENLLNQVYETLQQIKQIYDFTNLDSFFSTMAKNLEISEDATDYKLLDIEFIQEFLQMFILSNFFKPDEKHSKKLVLNFRDHSFVERFQLILNNTIIEKLTYLNLKPLFFNPDK